MHNIQPENQEINPNQQPHEFNEAPQNKLFPNKQYFENLQEKERKVAVKIENYLKSFRPKKIILQDICLEYQFPFWLKKEVIDPQIEVKAEEFIVNLRKRNKAQIQFHKNGVALKSCSAITRKPVPYHTITPVPSRDQSCIMALRGCRSLHYALWEKDIEIIKKQVVEEQEKFEENFGLKADTIDNNFGNETTDLHVYAQVFNCIIYRHQDIFPDPTVSKFEPTWKTERSYYKDSKGVLSEKQPWICHLLEVEGYVYAIRVQDFLEAKNIDYTVQKKIYYVPISYINECKRWKLEYDEYLKQIGDAIQLFDKNKLLTRENIQGFIELQSVVYFKKQDRKKTKSKKTKLQQILIKLGFEEQIKTIPDYFKLKQFYYQIKSDQKPGQSIKAHENTQQQNEKSIVNPNEQIQILKDEEKQSLLARIKDLEQQLENLKKQISQSSSDDSYLE